jgi:pyruvate dehydrogenase E2 component (dihydrolipoamide acetyltransferase)
VATQFQMPKLGLTMEEGTIVEWLVEPGAAVSEGTAVLRIETDKTETDVEAAASGHLYPVGAVGDTFACGELIGWFLADGEELPGAATATPATTVATAGGSSAGNPSTAGHRPAAPAGGRLLASPNARRLAAERGIDLAAVVGTGPNGRIVSEDLAGVPAPPAVDAAAHPPSAPPTAAAGPSPRPAPAVPATAAARQLADLLGIDLGSVTPDPDDGRVSREAVARHVRGLLAQLAPTAPPAASIRLAATQTPTETVPLRGMRGTIAKRMHQSLRDMAQLSLFMDADVGAVVAHRTARQAAGERVPSYTDYVIAAAARALHAHPRINSQITDDGIALLPDVHVGMAVALDDGLVVPVVRDVLARDLASLGAETTRLAAAARSGDVALEELEGGTFSVSTLGMYGVDGFTPVINPPNTAILGVGRLRNDVILTDGEVATVERITLSLTWDHRAFDGAPAAAFCRSVCEALGDPEALDRPA